MRLIAETAWHHEGDYAFMRSLIEALVKRGAQDVIKCHVTLDLDAYMLRDHPAWKTLSQWMLDQSQWMDILGQVQASENGLMCLCNDVAAVEFCQAYDPELLEIHAVNLNNVHLLEAVKQNKREGQKVVLGIGGSTVEEIDAAIQRLAMDQIVLMFGFQNYPTRYDRINLSRMRRMMRLYPEIAYGYADHCGFDEPENVQITLLGAAQGCSYVEKHVTTEMGKQRCDYEAAISIDMLNEIKKRLEVVEACNGDGTLGLSPEERAYGQVGPMKAAARAIQDIRKGEVLQEEMIVFRRTSQRSDLSQFDVLQCLGRSAVCDVEAGEVLQAKHFSA